MLLDQLLVLSLVTRSLAVASGAEVCADVSDHTSFLITHWDGVEIDAPAVQPRQEAREFEDPPIMEAQRASWGRRRASVVQLTEAGDGRLTSGDLADLEEVSQDAEEEDELERELEEGLFAGASGSKMATPWVPPLEPRVRDIAGCLLEGHPKKKHAAPLGSPVLVINLDSRPDRWASVLNSSGVRHMLRRASIEFERLSATQLRNMTDLETQLESKSRSEVLQKIEHATSEFARRRNSSSTDRVQGFFAALSCFVSHWRAIQRLQLAEQARKTRHAPTAYLVMEDDWLLRRDIVGMLPDVVRAVRDENWDVIRLDCWGYGGCKRYRNEEQLIEESGWPNKRVLRTSWQDKPRYGGSHAVLYRRESLHKIAEFFRDEPLRSVDDMLWTNKLQTYCVNWRIAKHVQYSGSNVSARQEWSGANRNRWQHEAEAAEAAEAVELTQLQRKAHLKKCREHRSEHSHISQ